MKISLIGAGNVAFVLGRLIKQQGHTIIEVINRDMQKAMALATVLNTLPTASFSEVNDKTELVIIAVSDNAIQKVCKEINFKNKMVVHTAGSVEMDILKNTSDRYGVLWPLQSLKKNIPYLPKIPLLVSGNNSATLNSLYEFATSLSEQVSKANDGIRSKLHLSAVAISNFTNHLFDLTSEYCQKENLDFSMLTPLIVETCNRAVSGNIHEYQTGPASRHDTATIDKHITMLQDHAMLQHIYKIMSDSIEQIHQ